MELQCLAVSGERPGPHLLITGGVHGDEFEPMVAIRRLATELSAAELCGRLTLIPVVNEDAFHRRHRCASDGLDLARTCPGRVDGSLTERVAHALASRIEQADFYIDLHTGGTTLSVWPLTGYQLHQDAQVRDASRAMAKAFNLPVVWGTSARLDGRSLSVARDAGVPSIYAEYLGAANCSPAGITAYVNGCLNVMAELGMLARPRPTSQLRYLVEDDRDGAGHMQIQNPAPMAGYFEPAVLLGQSICAGELLGTVSNSCGSEVREVRCTQTGVVLTLRTFPSVEAGDSVGVVLELESHLSGS